mmetsp:Transcript_14451/g.31119  ORF Transcript_14451/g.31119 Transcript_14451/m.31119 type:complete len:218 (-) Transcript_14451:2758-3411(-)
MIVCCEQSDTLATFHEMFDGGTCNCGAIESRCTPTKFVHDHKAPPRSTTYSCSSLGKLNKESRLTAKNPIRRTQTSKDTINWRESTLLSRHKGSNLSKNRDETRLTKESTLSSHVGPAQKKNARLVIGIILVQTHFTTQSQIVWNEVISTVSDTDARMSTLNHLDARLGIWKTVDNLRPAESRHDGNLGQRSKSIQHGRGMSCSHPNISHRVKLCKD